MKKYILAIDAGTTGITILLFDNNAKMKDITESLLFEKSPKTIYCDEFKQRILNQDQDDVAEKLRKKANYSHQVKHLLQPSSLVQRACPLYKAHTGRMRL